MITKTINGREISFIENWNEMTTGMYIDLIEITDIQDALESTEYMIRFLSIISGVEKEFFYDLYEDDMIYFVDLINTFDTNTLSAQRADSFNINGKLYAYDSIPKLTMGERISYNILLKKAKNEREGWLILLSIMVRPAEEFINEFGETEYKIIPFDGEEKTIERRKELFKYIPAVNALWILHSFQNGNAMKV